MNLIDDYSFGRIVIGGKTYTSDVIVFPDRVQGSWWRKEGHSLCLEDIDKVLQEKPEVLIVGTGSMGIMRVPGEVAEEIKQRGIELIIEKTASACQTFNQLIGKRLVVGAFHLTC